MRTVGRDDVQRLLTEGAQLLEVLEPDQYRQAHLPGAIHIPVRHLSRESAGQLRKDRPVVVYCFDNL
ncbi:MAG: rhodanese-like domain-containing protein [Acidimicrobiales bacterium]|nr:rhodanese-like domain-containing protein [Actinomycetota bacterium]